MSPFCQIEYEYSDSDIFAGGSRVEKIEVADLQNAALSRMVPCRGRGQRTLLSPGLCIQSFAWSS